MLEVLPPGSHVTLPDGGFFLWVRLPETIDATELQRRCRQPLNVSVSQHKQLASSPRALDHGFYDPQQSQERTVALEFTPGAAFGEEFRHYVRLSFTAAARAEIPFGVARLARALSEYPALG